jgi:hypothetical protein
MAIQYIKDNMGRVLGYLSDGDGRLWLHDSSKSNRIVATYFKNGDYTVPTDAKMGGRCNGNQLMRFLGR